MFSFSPVLQEQNAPPQALADRTAAPLAPTTLPNPPPRPTSPEPVDIADLTEMALANAPRCGGVPCRWVTIKQASRALGLSTSVISNFASRGNIAVVKGENASSHRLVHLENILYFLKSRMQVAAARAKERSGYASSEDDEAAAAH